MNYDSYKLDTSIQSIYPQNPKYFKEGTICEIISIPSFKPDIESILDFLVWPEIVDANLIEATQGVSNEGILLSGQKLVVELKLRQKLTYVENEPEHSVHANYFETLKSIVVMLPEKFSGKKTCDLLRVKRVSITPYIEDVYYKILDERNIYNCILIFVDVKFC
ncbi:hypothetical protein [Romboutsia sp.]|uniref:hypothetical protein n=1 Tax=Romboutsia sp. TaxID=1965302 RepID=UPI003F3ACDA5